VKTTFIILTVVTALLGCKDEAVKHRSIAGEWSLITFEPGFSPIETNNKGDIILKFHYTDVLE
jgi:hypothetical protein